MIRAMMSERSWRLLFEVVSDRRLMYRLYAVPLGNDDNPLVRTHKYK